MKIIYVANARIPTEKAHGIQIMKMCEAFAGAGADLELIIPKRSNWIKGDPFEYYGIKECFKIKKLPCLDLITSRKRFLNIGLWVETLTFSFSVLFYLLFSNSGLVYTRDKSILPLSLLGKNIVFEAHTFPRRYFLYSLFFKRLKCITVITGKLKDLFMDRGIAPDKILVVPDGVDLADFDIKEDQSACRERLELSKNKKIVLYAGHLYEWKGAQILAEASRYLPDDLEVYFVGGTKEDIEKFRIKNSELKISVLGHRPYSEMPYWLKAADVLVLPNSGKEEISTHWTSPLKMFEYMASKRPIVASDLPSIREILNEENAVLVKSDDAEALSLGIKKILQNPQLSDKISFRAFQDVQEYSWSKRAKIICQKLFW